ncbi:hypothetical protein GCM10023321_18170 [Pseudonocardia eucalypti]|uniref:50S ribosomal protein L29 n=1 Tax=Pseudonocardia eucalypti TaxID=648755 RepID=A0ABP9PSD5_9PSEU|nr:hypothetical protein [Pseudonocardia eucalypti]
MNLNLHDDEVEFLREILDSTARALTSEIAHTDNRLYRQTLKTRRDQTRTLRAKLETPPASEAS